MEDKTYNGWTNYATWRVNLEILDGHDWSDDVDDDTEVSDLADRMEEMVDEAVSGYGEVKEGLALDYARAFISHVNYYEIAEHVIDDYNTERKHEHDTEHKETPDDDCKYCRERTDDEIEEDNRETPLRA